MKRAKCQRRNRPSAKANWKGRRPCIMHRAKLALHIDTRHRLGHHFLLTHTYSACSVCIKEKPMSSVMSSFFFFFFFRNQGLWLPPIDANAPSTNPLSAVHNNSRCFCAEKKTPSRLEGLGRGVLGHLIPCVPESLAGDEAQKRKESIRSISSAAFQLFPKVPFSFLSVYTERCCIKDWIDGWEEEEEE